jgi:hypothetical protein
MQTPTRNLSFILLILALAVAAPSNLAAQDPAPDLPEEMTPWRMLLQQQLKSGKSCDLNEVLTFNELDLGDHRALEGRISCIDGREFTFSRPRPHQKFEFHLCEPTVC